MLTRRKIISLAALSGAAGLTQIANATDTCASGADIDVELQNRLGESMRVYASFGVKRSGSQGDLQTAEWIAGVLGQAGFSTHRSDFSVPTFSTSAAKIVAGDLVVEVVPQPVVIPTSPGGIQAKGALLHFESQASLMAGRLAFLVLPHDRHAAIFSSNIKSLVEAADKAGALAIVIVTTGPTDLIIGLNTRLLPMASVPVALMAPRDLPSIAKAIAMDAEFNFILTGEAGVGASCNIIGRREAGKNWLAFSTPRTGWGMCVGERAPGIAIFLELCRWAAKRYPHHSLFALNSGGHELDFIGTNHDLNVGPIPDRTVIWTHLGAGLATRDRLDINAGAHRMLRSADPQRVLMVSPTLKKNAIRAFSGLPGYDSPIEVIGGAGELSTIIDKGYRNAFAGLGVHRWCHTLEDTIERVDGDLLLPVYRAHQSLIELVLFEGGVA